MRWMSVSSFPSKNDRKYNRRNICAKIITWNLIDWKYKKINKKWDVGHKCPLKIKVLFVKSKWPSRLNFSGGLNVIAQKLNLQQLTFEFPTPLECSIMCQTKQNKPEKHRHGGGKKLVVLLKKTHWNILHLYQKNLILFLQEHQKKLQL